ncbi:MAG: cyclic nucleotide-binding and patatin-like phospholipase domain-containing protein [Vicinamibacterales bacterium]
MTAESAHLDLNAALGSADVFRTLQDSTRHALADAIVTAPFQPGDTLLVQGQRSDGLLVLISGAASTTFTDRQGASRAGADVGPGRVIGEAHLLSNAAASLTVRANSAGVVARLSRDAFERFTDARPADALELLDALRPLLRRHRLRAALHSSEAFGDLDEAVLADLESEMELVPLYGGEVLFREGSAGDSFYVVISGRLRVITATDGDGERILAELGTGETIGEMAILSGAPRSATVYAVRDTQLASLSRAGVERVLERHPKPMLHMLTGRLVGRLRRASAGRRERSSLRTVALVGASPDVPLRRFAECLCAALSRIDSCVLLTSEVVDAGVGRPGAAQVHDRDGGGTRLVEWLAEQEMAHGFVVYQVESALTPWTERCLRQADHVVLVGDAAGHPAPTDVETELLHSPRGRRTGQTLALLHRQGHVPKGTAGWLAGRSVQRHLHLRLDDAADFGRLARFLTGTAVGLALGGGFARGLAHLGVVKALGELGVPVDAIGGASMGAMVGAQVVLGWHADRIASEMTAGLADSFDDMTIPFLSFKRGGKYSRLVRRFFDDVRIEDLWLPFFCVSANLNRAELKVHTAGPLADAVLASTRAPGIFPPVVLDGELHVDGGVINNVPVDVMRAFSGDGIVIGVDVSPPHELNLVADYGEDVSGWKAFWQRFNPKRHKRIYRPSLLLVLMRVIEFGGISYRRQKAELADVYISPDVLMFKRNDFHASAHIAQAGYAATRETLTMWLQSEKAARVRPSLRCGSPSG